MTIGAIALATGCVVVWLVAFMGHEAMLWWLERHRGDTSSRRGPARGDGDAAP